MARRSSRGTPKASATAQATLKELPAVHDVLQEPEIAAFLGAVPRPLVIAAVQEAIAAVRDRLRREAKPAAVAAEALLAEVAAATRARLERERAPGPVRVINATGILVHTNLGRAPLAPQAVEHVARTAAGYSTLEYDLTTGERGSRQSHVEGLLRKILDVDSALAVNNNAAAVMLVLAALAAGKEVVVSRGELVEIGGSFRVPDILRASGAKLVEVGTTNRTHARDYEKAIGPETALLLKVHTSNFRVVGFTAEVGEAELARIARAAKVPLVVDIGSGLLADLDARHEPRPAAVVKHADLVTFSGDKLLGGPQAGIIAGSAALLERVRKHPLARAVRIDKLSLAALAATLRLTLDPEGQRSIPVVRMAREPLDRVKARAERLREAVGAGEVVPHQAAFGGGSVPGEAIPSWAVRIAVPGPDAIASALRAAQTPLIVRVAAGALWMDARTIADAEVETAAASVRKALK